MILNNGAVPDFTMTTQQMGFSGLNRIQTGKIKRMILPERLLQGNCSIINCELCLTDNFQLIK